MLTSISRFFESCLKAPSQETPQHAEHRLQLASAALLMELCVADQDFSNEEMHTLRSILLENFGLSGAELDTLWKLAREEVSSATSLYQFTSLINEQYDYPAKTRLLTCMWRVAYADGRIDRYEEHTIRKVADLLYLSHKDFIQTKLAVRPAS
jgi:uncharacterized tellurite resistance protein B-like protein